MALGDYTAGDQGAQEGRVLVFRVLAERDRGKSLDSFRRRLFAEPRWPDRIFFLVAHGVEIPRENGHFSGHNRPEIYIGIA